jgi:hypothetical protein
MWRSGGDTSAPSSIFRGMARPALYHHWVAPSPSACRPLLVPDTSCLDVFEREQDQKRADIRATHNSEQYITEVKSCEPHEDWRTLCEVADVVPGSLVTTTRQFMLNSLCGKIMSGYEQLLNTLREPRESKTRHHRLKPARSHRVNPTRSA